MATMPDKRLDFNRIDTVLIDTDNTTALVIDISVLLTQN
jgi:hypothetical protein